MIKRRTSILSVIALLGGDNRGAISPENANQDLTPAPPGERKVGIMYSLWHYTGDWPLWEPVWGKPVLGYYGSGQRDVIRQHAAWLNSANVDFLLLDWSNQIGCDNRLRKGLPWQLYIEDATETLFDEYSVNGKNLQLAFLIGTPGTPQAYADGRLSEKANQIYEQYARNDTKRRLLFELCGKPLLIVYVDTPSQFQGRKPEWDDDRFTIRFMTCFLSEQPTLLSGRRVSRFGYWSWEDRGPPTFSKFLGHPENMTVVASWRPDPGRIETPGRKGGATFYREWQLARREGPYIVLVSTFNEWRTGEQISPEISKDIEPSREFGYVYLDILRQQARLFKSGL